MSIYLTTSRIYQSDRMFTPSSLPQTPTRSDSRSVIIRNGVGYDDGAAAPEQIFSAKQVSERPGLSPAMTRRYGAALEQLTGEPIRQHARDGRQYRLDQVEVMTRAKSFVEVNSRLSVAQALQLALGEAPAVATPAVLEGSETPSEALSEALVQALERTLLPELRALREEVAGLRAEQREQRSAQWRSALLAGNGDELRADADHAVDDGDPPQGREGTPTEVSKVYPIADNPSAADGVLVRAARWLESLLRRSR